MNAISPRTLAVREQPLPETVIQCPHCQGDIKLTEAVLDAHIAERVATEWGEKEGLRGEEAWSQIHAQAVVGIPEKCRVANVPHDDGTFEEDVSRARIGLLQSTKIWSGRNCDFTQKYLYKNCIAFCKIHPQLRRRAKCRSHLSVRVRTERSDLRLRT